ncbi:MAG: response regulator [Pseudomonadales bacterium]|nr:response regulator [Pseudomonadales bacterium]
MQVPTLTDKLPRLTLRQPWIYGPPISTLKLTMLIGFMICIATLSVCHATQTISIEHRMPTTSIGEYIEYYEDKSGDLTYDDVLAPEHNNRFTLSRHAYLRFGYTRSTYWLRIKLKNTSTKDNTVILNINHPNIDKIHIYSEDQERPLQSAGNRTEQFYGDIRHHTYLFYLDLKAHEEQIFYLSLNSTQYLNFLMTISSPEQFLQTLNMDQVLFGLSFGIIIGLFIYHIFVYYSVRETSHLYYIFLLISLLVFLSSQTGYFSFIWRFSEGLQRQLDSGSALLVISMAAFFARYYLKMPDSADWLHKLLQFIAYFSLICCTVLPFTPADLGTQVSVIVAISISPFLVGAGMISWLNGYAPARYFFLSRSIYLLTLILILQTAYGYLPTPIQITHVLLFAGICEAILLSLGLAERVSELKNEHQNLHQKTTIAEVEIRTKTEFLAKMSHEIRTPMNGILGMAELLEDTPLTTTQDDFVKTIHESGNNLLKILDDILDYSKIDAGQIELHIQPFDLTTLIINSINSLKLIAEEKKLLLVNDLATDVPIHLSGDAIRLQQIITCLASIVIKYSEEGELRIITSQENSDKNVIQFKVESTSTGSGIPRDLLEQLSLHTHNTGNDIAAEFGHTGVGLMIAKQLIELMHGSINAKMITGKGGALWFSVPLRPQLKATTIEKTHDANLEELKLLIVDDNASCRLVIGQQASSWGMKVTTAINGKHALAILRTQANLKEPFDIVILDYDMPSMNGLELAAKVREDGLITHDILLLMMTGLGISPDTTAARNAGIRRVLTKPVSGKLLKITLAEELSHMQRALGNNASVGHNIQKFQVKIKILVAEDHHLSQKVIKGMLAKLGVDKVETVDDGEKAIAAIKTDDYDLILMDYDMPVKNGFEAARDIRQWEKNHSKKTTPIIALSAHKLDEQKEISLQCGVNALLMKPVELFELQDMLIKWTRVEPSTSESPSINSH